MQIKVRELEHTDVIALQGRLERASIAELTQALETSNQRGKRNLVVDMSQLEYISSVGLRALLNAQRNNRLNRHGELLLAQLPAHIHEALEVTGFTELFRTFADLPSAIEFASSLPGDPTSDAPPLETPKGK